MEKLRHLLTVEGLWSLSILLRDHWSALLVALLGGGGMTYLAVITDWINQYGPIAWGLSFFLGAYCSLGIIYVWSSISSKRFINRQAEASFSKSGINPRDFKFEKQSVPLLNFFSPFYFPHKDKVFIECDIVGPSMLFLDGCNLDGVHFRHCQIVVCRTDVKHFGVTAFIRCKVLGGTMSNITLVVNRGQYDALPEELRANVNTMHELAT